MTALFVTASGGDYGAGRTMIGEDCLTPHLRTVMAFLGLPNPDVIGARPLPFGGPETRDKAIRDARADRDPA